MSLLLMHEYAEYLPPTGGDDTPMLTAALAQSNVAYQLYGTYSLGSPVIVAGSNVTLLGPRAANPCIIQNLSTWLPVVGSIDDRDVAFFRLSGVTSGGTTTLNGNQSEGRRSVLLTNTAAMGTITDGTWIRIMSTSVGGIANIIEEIVQASGSPTANRVPLRTPLLQPHTAAGSVVQVITPVSGFTLENATLRATGNHACGISMRNARQVYLRDVAIEGWGRAGIDVQGSREVYIGHVDDRGGNNALVLFQSSGNSVIGDGTWTSNDIGLRNHPNGIRRGKVRTWMSCANVAINPGYLANGVKGVEISGNLGGTLGNLELNNFLCDAFNDTGWLSGGCFGVAVDFGTSEITHAEFGKGMTCGDITASELYSSNVGFGILAPTAVFVHDMLDTSIGNITIKNANPPGTNVGGDTTYNMQGVGFQDWAGGAIKSIVTAGVGQGVWGNGSGFNLHIGAVYLDMTNCSASFGAYWNHQGGSTAGPTRFGEFQIIQAASPVGFGANFNNTDPYTRFDTLSINGLEWTDARFARWSVGGNSPAPAAPCILDAAAGAGQRNMVAAGADSPGPWVSCCQSANFFIVAPLPGGRNSVNINAAAPNGSIIATASATQFKVQPAATFLTMAGRVDVPITGAGITTVAS